MKIGKLVAFLGLLLLGFVGLAMTACGGGFLVMFLRSGSALQGWVTIAAITVPSLVMGLVALFFVGRTMKVLFDKER